MTMARLPLACVWCVALLTTAVSAARPANGLRLMIVEDDSDQPVRTALVSVVRPSGEIARQVHTDRDGLVTVEHTGGAPLDLTIEKSHHVPLHLRVERPATEALGGDQPIRLRLVRRGAIGGTIAGARGGTVNIVEDVPAGITPRHFSTRLDDSGRFRAFGVPLGRYHVAAAAIVADGPPATGLHFYPDNAQPAALAITGGEEHDLHFVTNENRTSKILIRVRTTTGPMPTVTLTLRSVRAPAVVLWAGLFNGSIPPHATVNLMPGAYELIAAALPFGTGRQLARVGFESLDLPEQEIELVLDAAAAAPAQQIDGGREPPIPAAIQGRVRPLDSHAPVLVVLSDITPGRESAIRAELTAAGGAFAFDDVPAGRYVIASHVAGATHRWGVPPDAPSLALESGEVRMVLLQPIGVAR